MQFSLQARSTTDGYFGSPPTELVEMVDGKWGNIVLVPLVGDRWHTPGSRWNIIIWQTQADLDSSKYIDVQLEGMQVQEAELSCNE